MRTLTIVLAAAALAGCLSAEDKEKAKTKAELDLEQAELIVDGDCKATDKALDSWYDKNKSKVDPIEKWWKTKSDDEKDRLMEEHKELRNKAFKRIIGNTIRCGFTPMADKRQG